MTWNSEKLHKLEEVKPPKSDVNLVNLVAVGKTMVEQVSPPALSLPSFSSPTRQHGGDCFPSHRYHQKVQLARPLMQKFMEAVCSLAGS